MAETRKIAAILVADIVGYPPRKLAECPAPDSVCYALVTRKCSSTCRCQCLYSDRIMTAC